jgi:serine protease
VEYALSKHVVVVAAAGNAGNDRPHYPSAYPGVISVSASDQNDHLAKFSSHGKQVVVSAPGVDVLQQVSDGSFKPFSGTSMASPHVNFLANQLVSLGLRGEAVKDAVTSNADPKEGQELLFGAGIINALKTTRHVYWSQLAYRTLALFAFAFFIKRRITKVGGTPVRPGTIGMLFAGTGLLPFLPLVDWMARLGSLRWIGELAVRPFGMWDVIYSANLHNWLPLAGAMPSVLLLLTLYGIKAARAQVGGFSIGTAALLSQLVIQNDGDWNILFRGFMLANLALVVWIARVCLDNKMDANDAVIPNGTLS